MFSITMSYFNLFPIFLIPLSKEETTNIEFSFNDGNSIALNYSLLYLDMEKEDIIKEFNVEPHTLKIDCEGCEVNILKHSDLSMLKQSMMEYHTNFTGVDENILIDILKNQGFELKNRFVDLVNCWHILLLYVKHLALKQNLLNLVLINY